MAGSVNKVILVGNLGRDPEIRRTQDGRPIANLSVATSENWRDKATGERREKTEWHRVVIFNEGLCKVVEQYLKKGAKVYLEGQLQTRKYTDKDGVEKYSTEVVLQGFNSVLTMLDGARRRRWQRGFRLGRRHRISARRARRRARASRRPPAPAASATGRRHPVLSRPGFYLLVRRLAQPEKILDSRFRGNERRIRVAPTVNAKRIEEHSYESPAGRRRLCRAVRGVVVVRRLRRSPSGRSASRSPAAPMRASTATCLMIKGPTGPVYNITAIQPRPRRDGSHDPRPRQSSPTR